MRQDRVGSLKAAIQDGRYQPPPEQVAQAMFSDDIARVDLLRRSHLSKAQDARTATLQELPDISGKPF